MTRARFDEMYELIRTGYMSEKAAAYAGVDSRTLPRKEAVELRQLMVFVNMLERDVNSLQQLVNSKWKELYVRQYANGDIKVELKL